MPAARSWYAPVVARLRTTNPYVVDSALAVLVLFAASLQWMFPDEGDDPLSLAGWLLGAATAVPLVWRRRFPYSCAVAVSAATTAMAYYHAPPPDVLYGGLVVLYTMAAQALPWQRRSMLAGWLLGAVLTMQHKEHSEPFEYAFHITGMICAYGLGVLARVQRAYTAAVEDRARRLERERAAETARAIAQERSRIARDMHDILAHAVSLMVVQAEAGPVVVRSDPERAEAAFDAIAGQRPGRHDPTAAHSGGTEGGGAPGRCRPAAAAGSRRAARSDRPGRRIDAPAGRVERPRAAAPAAPGHRGRRLPSGAGSPDQHGEARVRFLRTGGTRLGGGRVDPHGDGRRRWPRGVGGRPRADRAQGAGGRLRGQRAGRSRPGGGLPGRRTAARRRGPGSGPRVSIRVVVADDQELVRSGFTMILEAQQDIEVVAEAGDGAAAVEAVRGHSPDVLLLDIRMPVMDGLEAARRVCAQSSCKVVMLTTFDLDEYVYDALYAGASGFLLKDVRRDDLVHAVRVVAGGDSLLAPTVTRRLVADIVRRRREEAAAEPAPDRLDALTAREVETLRMLARVPVERRDRHDTLRQRAHGQDPCQQRPEQAGAARPGAGGHLRLRDGPGDAGHALVPGLAPQFGEQGQLE
ncbi:DNA-binding NarL/FixJ family response regulator [Streptomyces pseudovenezuelae]